MFIFDEVHLVGEPERGWTLEEDLTFLHYMTQDTDHRIVLMSAAVGNRNHLVTWMGEEGNGVTHHHSEWRGPRRLHAIWTTTADRNKGRVELTRSKKYPSRINYPLHGRLDVRISHTGALHSLQTKGSIGNLAFKIPVKGRREKDVSNSTPFYQMIIPIIQLLGQSGPVLVIESTRRNTVLMAKAIANGEDGGIYRLFRH
jgi:Lhr-like helicase